MLHFVRNITYAVILLAILAAISLLLLGTIVLQNQPILATAKTPDAPDVAATRTLVRNIRDATQKSGGVLNTDADQLNSALRLGARFLPGFRGEIRTEPTHVTGLASIPVPWVGGQRWLNITAQIPEFTGLIALSEVRVGDRNFSPALVLGLVQIGGNAVFGNELGDIALRAAESMEIKGDVLSFGLNIGEIGKNGLMRGTFNALKGSALPTAEEIEAYHRQIRREMEDGRLPETGSFLPHLQFTLAAARNGSAPTTLQGRYTAAILGLAKACGAKDFSLIAGRLVFDKTEQNSWQTNCRNVTLNDRIDSHRHFLTSAALQAMSNTGFAVSAGEFKELYDTVSGSGGFDFTDMTANLSGVRMSNTLMAAPAADWPALLAKLSTERAVIPDFDGIPPLMPDAEFRTRFGNIDSTAYRAMIARIEARIDGLSLHGTQ